MKIIILQKWKNNFFEIMMTIFIPSRNFILLNCLYFLMYRNTYHVTYLTLDFSILLLNFLCQIKKINAMSHRDPAWELSGRKNFLSVGEGTMPTIWPGPLLNNCWVGDMPKLLGGGPAQQ